MTVLLGAAALVAPVSAQSADDEIYQVVRTDPIGKDRARFRRPGFEPYPPANPYTDAKARLGKLLFFDPRLSDDGLTACASCHNPGLSWDDGRVGAKTGSGPIPWRRRAMALLDVAWNQMLMWDGRFDTLEDQALAPLQGEHGMARALDVVIGRLASIDGYRDAFVRAFGSGDITPRRLAKALATFERTIVSGISPFDRWINGDSAAIPVDAVRGFWLFTGRAGCARCHDGWRFTDDRFHDIGLATQDPGRGRLLPHIERMQHAFKTPSLRNVARRGPYMHDGSLATLEQVIDHYDRGGIDRPSRTPGLGPLGLSPADKADLIAFLHTLTGELPPVTVATLPR